MTAVLSVWSHPAGINSLLQSEPKITTSTPCTKLGSSISNDRIKPPFDVLVWELCGLIHKSQTFCAFFSAERIGRRVLETERFARKLKHDVRVQNLHKGVSTTTWLYAEVSVSDKTRIWESNWKQKYRFEACWGAIFSMVWQTPICAFHKLNSVRGGTLSSPNTVFNDLFPF